MRITEATLKTSAAWLAIAGTFVLVGGLSAHAQDVPTSQAVGGIIPASLPFVVDESAIPKMVDGAWTFPERETRSSGVNSSSGYVDAIYAAAEKYGISGDYLLSVAQCESGLDHSAVAYNPVSGNMTLGIFQIDEMWGSVAYADAYTQIDWAAQHLAAGDIWWACG